MHTQIMKIVQFIETDIVRVVCLNWCAFENVFSPRGWPKKKNKLLDLIVYTMVLTMSICKLDSKAITN